MSKILYLSYDGMTDPLGQSQVLPYVIGLAKAGYNMHIVSFEKADKLKELEHVIQKKLDKYQIKWSKLTFYSAIPILSKIWNQRKFNSIVKKICKTESVKLLHCRSYVAAIAALHVKKRLNIPYLFDMRGFWVDERVDSGNWDQKKWYYRLIYKRFKKIEQELVANANHIISLTEVGKDEIHNWQGYKSNPVKISVIPTCSDFEHFKVKTDYDHPNILSALNIPKKQLIIGYLGNLESTYLPNELLKMFAAIKNSHSNSIFLVISKSSKSEFFKLVEKMNIPKSAIFFVSAQRDEVPALMSVFDYLLCFVKPTYAKLASSPTKIGEALAMGVPVICNDNIGDLKTIIAQLKGGIAFDNFSDEQFEAIATEVLAFSSNPSELRKRAFEYYSLEAGVTKLEAIYTEIVAS